ncbi:MAG: FxsA family protein [Gammaproteobacteria bacterium]|nr:FxsA family protein [Gammaproteobacteria bacterium]MBQ0840828.1 FxsA family protein [Gammaproteobacteria bacterium]
MRILLLVFIVVPIVEMWLLIQVGGVIGALPTIASVLLTAMIGLALLRRQGLSTLLRVNQRMESGELPAQEMLEGIVLAVSGALLLTPGFFTDAIGFAGLTPVIRQWLVRRLVGRVKVFEGGVVGASVHREEKNNNTLEGEYWREEDEP